MIRVKACDISVWQKGVDFRILREEGYEVLFIRLCFGMAKDNQFDIHAEQATMHGFHWSPYIYFLPQQKWQAQVAAVKQYLTESRYKPDMPISGDMETTGGIFPYSHVLNRMRLFMTDIQPFSHQFSDKPCLLYTSPGFWNQIRGFQATWATNFDLWLAQWMWDNMRGIKELLPLITQEILSGQHNPSMVPKPWTEPTWWQYSARGSSAALPYAGDLDLDSSIANRQQVMEYYFGEEGAVPIPQNFEELRARFLLLEQWAVSQGYIISKGD
jgi:GH25 family lysozyme M1 (1,4-beta-N-acetylmuramidase)